MVDANDDDDRDDDRDDNDDDNDRDVDGRWVLSTRMFIDSMNAHQSKMEWTIVSSLSVTSSMVVEVGSLYMSLWVAFTVET